MTAGEVSHFQWIGSNCKGQEVTNSSLFSEIQTWGALLSQYFVFIISASLFWFPFPLLVFGWLRAFFSPPILSDFLSSQFWYSKITEYDVINKITEMVWLCQAKVLVIRVLGDQCLQLLYWKLNWYKMMKCGFHQNTRPFCSFMCCCFRRCLLAGNFGFQHYELPLSVNWVRWMMISHNNNLWERCSVPWMRYLERKARAFWILE